MEVCSHREVAHILPGQSVRRVCREPASYKIGDRYACIHHGKEVAWAFLYNSGGVVGLPIK